MCARVHSGHASPTVAGHDGGSHRLGSRVRAAAWGRGGAEMSPGPWERQWLRALALAKATRIRLHQSCPGSGTARFSGEAVAASARSRLSTPQPGRVSCGQTSPSTAVITQGLAVVRETPEKLNARPSAWLPCTWSCSPDSRGRSTSGLGGGLGPPLPPCRAGFGNGAHAGACTLRTDTQALRGASCLGTHGLPAPSLQTSAPTQSQAVCLYAFPSRQASWHLLVGLRHPSPAPFPLVKPSAPSCSLRPGS